MIIVKYFANNVLQHSNQRNKVFYVILVCAGPFYLHSQMKDEVLTLLNCHDKYVKLPYHPILLSSASDLEEWRGSNTNPREDQVCVIVPHKEPGAALCLHRKVGRHRGKEEISVHQQLGGI